MVTIGGLANASPQRGVMLYNPTVNQRAPVQVRPTSRTTAPKKKNTGGLPDDIDPRFIASSEELSKRVQAQQKKEASDLPWWQDALGFTANVLSPLTVPGKVVTFGLEQATRHLPDPVRRFMQDPASYVTPDSWEKNKYVDALTEATDAAIPLLNPFMGQDIEKVDADKRSFFNKIAPRSSYGSEAIYQDIGVPGMTGLRNLALDVGHDPLTVISGGERVFAKGAEMTADAAKAVSAANRAGQGFETAVDAYARALREGAHPMLQHGLSKVADETAANLAKATTAADRAAAVAEGSRKVVHAPSTVAQRASFVASLAGKDPELVAKYQSELTKGINRGFGRMSAEAREAIEMAPRGLRIAGTDVRIPGTAKLVEGSGILGSGLHAGMSKVGEYLPEQFRNMRTPDTLAEARRGLRSKSTSPEQYQLYADYLRITNDIRLGTGEMNARGAQAVNREWKDNFAKLGESERDAMRVAAEASPEANKVNELMIKLAKVHEQITGRPFEDFSSINTKQYLPHIQTKEWAKWLKEHPDDPRAVAYRKATDFKTRDMLHTSGYVDRARQLRLAPGETSKEIPLGDRTLRLNGNTINHLNEGLEKAFPEFTGKFYETNLDKIFQVYSEALARDAGTRRGWTEAARSATPNVRTVEGELADSLDKMNEALRQQSQSSRLRKMVEDRGGKFTPGERLEVPARPLAPGTTRDRNALAYWANYGRDLSRAVKAGDIDEVYRLTDEAAQRPLPRSGVEVLGKDPSVTPGFTRVRIEGKVTEVPDAALALGPAGDIPAEHLDILTPRVSDSATRDLTNWAQSGVPTAFAGASNAEGTAVRQQILTGLQDMRTNAYEGLRNEVNAGSARIKSLREVADEYVATIKGVGKVDRNNAAQVTALKETVDKNILDLQAEIKARNSVWKGKGTREANKIDKELNRQLRVLKDHVANLERKLNELPAEIRREIKWRREQLFKPVEDARSNLRQAESHFKMRNPLPYTPEQITWAQETELAGRRAAHGVTETAEQLRDEYRKAVTKLEGLRNRLSKPKLTPESVAKVQAQIAKQGEVVEGILGQARQAREAGTDVVMRRPALPVADRAKAQEILANVAEYEKRLNDSLVPYQKRLDDAMTAMRRQPEALVYDRPKSMRYFHDEIGRGIPDVSGREDVFGGRRVEPVTTPPQRGAYIVDAPGKTQPGLAEPDIQPFATTKVVPKGQGGQALRRRASDLLSGADAEGAVPLPGGTHAVQVPPQRLETQALTDLERLAGSPERSGLGRYAANQREAAQIAEDTLPTRIANQQKVAAEANELGRLTEVLPKEAEVIARQRAQAGLANLDPITKELAAEVDTRGQLRVLRDQYKSLPLGTKKVDIDATIRDLEQFNANNPLLDDATRAATDQLLKEFTTESQRIAGNKDVVAGLGKMARDARSGKLKDEYLGGLAEGWSGIHKGPVQRGDVIMDDRLRAMLQRAEETIDDPKLFGRVFNELTNVFKTYATLSPSFHVRNGISGIFMNAADGVSLVSQLDGWKLIRQYRTAPDGEAWLARQTPEVREAFTIMGGSGGGGRFAEAGFAGLHDKAALNKVTRNRATLFSQRAGERVEQSLRMGMALDSVRKGMDMHSALERITKIHFDYSQLSKLDETMKRLIPFWTFMSRNLPLQLQMVYTMPQMYSAYEHFKRNMSAPDAAFTPGYWKIAGAFNTGATIAGMPAYLQPDMGIDQIGTQLQQLKEIGSGNFGAALSELNPIALAPLEYMFKKDLFRDRTFTDADYSKASGPIGNLVKALATVVPGGTKTVGGERLVADNFMNLLTSIVPPISQASRLAPQATGELSDLDRQLEAIARYIGIPVRTLSPKQQQTEQRNRYYDAKDAATTAKKLARRAAA